MRLIEIKEDSGGVITNFEIEEEKFFALFLYESDGEFCLQVINSDGFRSNPVTVKQWFKFDKKISEIYEKATLAGLNIKKEELRQAILITLLRIENDEQLKSVLLRETTEPQTPVEEKPKIQLTEDEEKEAIELLESPRLLNEIMRLIRKRLVKEERNALLVFFTMLSAKLKEPLNLRFSGETSTGKSAIIRAVARLFPPEMVIIRTALTRKALYYSNIGKKLEDGSKLIDFTGKVLVLLEENNCKDFIEEFKPVLSHDLEQLESEFTDTSGKEITARKIIIKGFPAYIGLLASRRTTDEDDTRTLLATPEKSKEKIKAVHEFTNFERAFPWRFNGVDEEEKKLWNAIRILESYDGVVIPFTPLISEKFPHVKPKEMRDYNKLLNLIEAVALLFQRKRKVVEFYGKKYLVAQPIDFVIASEILKEALEDTLTNLEADVRRFFNKLCDEDGGLGANWNRKELLKIYKEVFGYSTNRETFRRRFLEPLVREGFLDEDDSKKPYIYSIGDKSLQSLQLHGIIVNELFNPKIKEILRSKFLHTSLVEYNTSVKNDELEVLLNACFNHNTHTVLYLSDLVCNLREIFKDFDCQKIQQNLSEPHNCKDCKHFREIEEEEEEEEIEENNNNNKCSICNTEYSDKFLIGWEDGAVISNKQLAKELICPVCLAKRLQNNIVRGIDDKESVLRVLRFEFPILEELNEEHEVMTKILEVLEYAEARRRNAEFA